MTTSKESLDLSGWWHTHFKVADKTAPLPPEKRPLSRAYWQDMEDVMESFPVPSLLDAERASSIVWQWRPVIVPEEWHNDRVILHLEGLYGTIEIYVDRTIAGQGTGHGQDLRLDLSRYLVPGKRHTLFLRFAPTPEGSKHPKRGITKGVFIARCPS